MPQIKLSGEELDRLARRIEEDYDGAKSAHQIRIQRWAEYYRRFRNLENGLSEGEEGSTFDMPLTQWQTYAKLAATVHSIFGEDAEVVALPSGPSDARNVGKIGKYATQRFLRQMDSAVVNFTIFFFRVILFGRAFAYRPWVVKTFENRKTANQEIWYEGAAFDPCYPDDIIVPAEEVRSIQDYSFVIRKYRATPQDLLDGEKADQYFGIEEDFERIIQLAEENRNRDGMDVIKDATDEAEGVLYEGSTGGGRLITIYEWYGRWRKLKGKADAETDDLTAREMNETELVVRWIPELRKVVSVEDLADKYQATPFRRPFSDASIVKDGSSWPPGLGEQLSRIEWEATKNHRMFTEAGEWAVCGPTFYDPASGFKPESMKMEPRMMIPSSNPNGVNKLDTSADLQYSIVKEQSLLAYAERITGQSDQSLGRASDRPNAPKTASGQAMLLEQGNIRSSLDTMMLREDMARILLELWLLDTEFADEQMFFRITEEDAKGIGFNSAGGGAYLTADERSGRYDFDIRFATNIYSREAKKQETLARYQLDLANPLINTNPQALWAITAEVHKALGDPNFSDIVPQPPPIDIPRNPKEEWAMLQQGDDIDVNPADVDDDHIVDHGRRMMQESQNPQANPALLQLAQQHIMKHVMQKQQKLMLQAQTEMLMQSVVQAGQQPPQQQGQIEAPPQNPMMGTAEAA